MLQAAAIEFALKPRVGDRTAGHTNALVQKVAGPIKSTVTLLDDGRLRICLLASHYGTSIDDATHVLQSVLAGELGIDRAHVLVFSSHSHSAPLLASHSMMGYEDPAKVRQRKKMTPLGTRFVRLLRRASRQLPGMLRPVTVEWACGHEDRITYNRKGRRADGSTYLMREEDRVRIARDFKGDIDPEAPLVVLRDSRTGRPVTAIAQFTGHPVTAYHAEKFVAYGEWPQVACDHIARFLGKAANGKALPVSFLQGCAGEINSKEMFAGGVERSRRYGDMLGRSYIKALRRLTPSARQGVDYALLNVNVPLAPLPGIKTLRRELAEIHDYVARVRSGDNDAITCVGLNFPRALSSDYRARLAEHLVPWTEWAIDLHKRKQAHTVARALPLETYVLRIGDVGIVGMPTEPFQGIGRLIRTGSRLPLTIPCGYTNSATGFIGYVPDSPNVGDREYMSAFYRYTRYLPPFRRPAGNVLARAAVHALNQFARRTSP